MKAVRLHTYGERPAVDEVAEPEITDPLDVRRQAARSPIAALLVLDRLDALGARVGSPSGCSFVIEAEASDDVRVTPAQDDQEKSNLASNSRPLSSGIVVVRGPRTRRSSRALRASTTHGNRSKQLIRWQADAVPCEGDSVGAAALCA